MKRLAILGSTGSIGCEALKVVERHSERFVIQTLAANRSVEALAEQVRRVKPRCAVLADPDALLEGASSLAGGPNGHDASEPSWRVGREALLEAARASDVDVVLNALVGFAGLAPTLEALRAGKRVALANKESLVAGGPLVLQAATEGGGQLVPVDSEHSAILQCLEGYPRSSIHRLVITASGGPFRGWSPGALESVGPEDALRHPTWDMGAKITVDSATLANKALEVIEAHFLYDIPYDAIDVVVHPQSVVHSFVEFVDGSVIAQMGFPTMELPILYALSYPDRLDDASLRTFDPVGSSPLTFEEVDHAAFPLFGLGLEAGRAGGTAPAAFNAANEVAVEAFLKRGTNFPGMAVGVKAALEEVVSVPVRHPQDVMEADRRAREVARKALTTKASADRRPG